MDVTNPLCPVSKDEAGCYMTLSALKNIQYGDKSTITEVNTPLTHQIIPEEVQNDKEKWDTFSKFYFCKSLQDIKKYADQFTISYNRIDGKPERATLTHLYKVSLTVYQCTPFCLCICFFVSLVFFELWIFFYLFFAFFAFYPR